METRHSTVEAFPVTIPITDKIHINGDLNMPSRSTRGVVVFAHGSGSSRFSPRNRYVAQKLNDSGCATLLVDLLTPTEEQEDELTREYRFDIPMLANRLVKITEWLKSPQVAERPLDTTGMRIGMFGASTGGAAALIASVLAKRGAVECVVSRGGRVDLGGEYLGRVSCPCLFLVGGRDTPVIRMNRDAFKNLTNVEEQNKQLEIVDGASHLFEEPGKLEIVADRASRFFSQHLLQ